jgi:hypothetical protein
MNNKNLNDLNLNKIINYSIEDSRKKIAQNRGFFIAFLLGYLAYLNNDFKIIFYVFFLTLFLVSAYFPELFLRIKFFTPFEKFNNFIFKYFGLIFKTIIFLTIILPMYFYAKFFQKHLLFSAKKPLSDSFFVDCSLNKGNLKKYFNLLIVFKKN